MTPNGEVQRRSYDQACPVAHALDVVGERWTLLIIRDLMFGGLRFSDLRDGLPGLAPNLLSDRLRHLVEHGLVEQRALTPPSNRSIYALTPRGRELGPVVYELARFGVAEWSDPAAEPPPTRLIRGAVLALMDPHALTAAAWNATLELDHAVLGLMVSSVAPDRAPLDRLRVRELADRSQWSPDVAVVTTLATLWGLRQGTETRGEAEEAGRLSVSGSQKAADRLGRLMGWR